MRPLVLVALLFTLAGCSSLSMNYEGKTFSAVEKPHHKAEGEEHVVNDHPGEVSSSPQEEALREGSATVESVGPEGTVARSASASAFPPTAQPTGRPPVLDSAPSEAGRNSQPVHEGHE